MSGRCSYCGECGHNRRTCPSLKRYIADNPDSYIARRESDRKEIMRNTARKCSYCQDTGHNRRTCPVLKRHKQAAKRKNQEFRVKLLDSMREHGFGEGALVEEDIINHSVCGYIRNTDGELKRPSYEDDIKAIGMITRIEWNNACYRRNGAFCRIAWLNLYDRNGAQKISAWTLGEFDVDKYVQRVKSPVSADRVEASKPYGWEFSSTSDVAHIFEDSKACYHTDLD